MKLASDLCKRTDISPCALDVFKTHVLLDSVSTFTMPNKSTTLLQVWGRAVAVLLVLGCVASAEEYDLVRQQPL